MSIENLTIHYIHINKFGHAAGKVRTDEKDCEKHLTYKKYVCFDEALAEQEKLKNKLRYRTAKK